MATQVLPPPMPAAPVPLHYPESDGRPLAETEAHAQCLIDSRESLRAHFRDDPNVHVGGNLLFYYSEGEPRQCVAPDVFVVRGVPRDKQLRDYKLWEEGHVPEFVLEISSASTRYEDLGAKRGLYQVLGVREYFLFDPLREYLRPPLQGFRLAGEEYRPIVPMAEGALASETLGFELCIVDGQLRFYDPRAGLLLRAPAEEVEARQEAEQRATQQAVARQAAEQQAEREAAARQAAEERAAAAEAELARLRAEMATRQP